MSVKISELTTLASQLQSADYIPIVRSGVTYKYAPFGYVVKNTGNETIAGVKTFSSSPVVPAATTSTQAVNKSQLDTVEDKATPLSDLSRVLALNGDGIPMFPDNVAGTTYKSNFATTDGWTALRCTISVSNGRLIVTATDINPVISRTVVVASKLVAVRLKKLSGNATQSLLRATGTPDYLYSQPYSGGLHAAVFPSDASANFNIYPGALSGLVVAGDQFEISGIYIGSGAYDTKVYGKDGQNVFDNVGVLPVPGPRGMAMAFLGNGYLTGNSSVFGATGTMPMYWKRGRIGVAETLFSNRSASTNGLQYYISDTNALYAIFGGSSLVSVLIKSGWTDTASFHSFGVVVSGTTATPFYDGVFGTAVSVTSVAGLGNLTIGRNPLSSADYAVGSGYFGGYLNFWTQDDVTRYHNGDDMVDSQQKSTTGTPHSLAVYGADGRLGGIAKQADNATTATTATTALYAMNFDLVIDSNAKLAAWAASGTYEKVLIKTGTWTLASGGVDLTARGTKLVVGEPGSKLVFSSAEKGLYYTTPPTTNDYRMEGVTVETTGSSSVSCFGSCTNLTNCTGTGVGTSASEGAGFRSCTNLTNCTGTGTAGYGSGFRSCKNLTNCTGTGVGTDGGDGYGFDSCKKCQQNKKGATSTTATYVNSYADAGTSYPCADTPNGGFNS